MCSAVHHFGTAGTSSNLKAATVAVEAHTATQRTEPQGAGKWLMQNTFRPCCRDQELAALQKELAKRDKALKAAEKALAAKEGRAAKVEERLKRREEAIEEREVGLSAKRCSWNRCFCLPSGWLLTQRLHAGPVTAAAQARSSCESPPRRHAPQTEKCKQHAFFCFGSVKAAASMSAAAKRHLLPIISPEPACVQRPSP
jgi:hypothetical protein